MIVEIEARLVSMCLDPESICIKLSSIKNQSVIKVVLWVRMFSYTTPALGYALTDLVDHAIACAYLLFGDQWRTRKGIKSNHKPEVAVK